MAVCFRSQRLTLDQDGCNAWTATETAREVDFSRSAVILCDVWDRHWNVGATKRLERMLGDIDRTVGALRSKGAFVIHCPSDCMDYYRDFPGRARMAQYADTRPAAVRDLPEITGPLDASDGGNDANQNAREVNLRVWTRQHPSVEIDDADGISDSGGEVYGYLKAHDITTVFVMGVHTNMCVLHRSFAIQNLVRWGFDVALVRDLTDPMYNPALQPYVNREEALRLIVGFIEKFWCPSVSSDELLQ